MTTNTESRVLETLIVDRGGGPDSGIVTVTLNRPAKKNAINAQMWLDLRSVLIEVGDRSDDRCLVITGAGGAFCSGADLTGDAGGERPHQLVTMRHIGDVALELHRLPKPTIAKVTGVAVGAGCSMAMGCDLIVASEDARFSVIFARRGLALDFGASWLLPRLVGLHRAKELALLADVISAAEAKEMGLVNRVIDSSEIDGFVSDWARRLAAGPPLALSMTKQMLNHSSAVSMAQALDDEARCQTVTTMATTDTAEAMAAFVEKRPPVFHGR